MSGGALVLPIVLAVVFAAVAVQVTARHLQRYPVDTRRNGSLLETTRETSWVVRPAELDQLTAIVSESLSSEAVARSKLHPLLDELERSAPHRGSTSRASAANRSNRRNRARYIDDRLADLESAWGIDDER
ncbi:MAG: hypothetical protein ACR2QO_20295 [Acidimicrobiales bacterium]